MVCLVSGGIKGRSKPAGGSGRKRYPASNVAITARPGGSFRKRNTVTNGQTASANVANAFGIQSPVFSPHASAGVFLVALCRDSANEIHSWQAYCNRNSAQLARDCSKCMVLYRRVLCAPCIILAITRDPKWPYRLDPDADSVPAERAGPEACVRVWESCHENDHRRSLCQSPPDAWDRTCFRDYRVGIHTDLRYLPQGGYHLLGLCPRRIGWDDGGWLHPCVRQDEHDDRSERAGDHQFRDRRQNRLLEPHAASAGHTAGGEQDDRAGRVSGS